MHPAEKRNSSSETLGEAPAKKVSEPPVSNGESKKSSILKAFEAIVAASRRGLLGPAAMAAVEGMPDVDLKCCDEKVGQETPSSSLDEEERRKEERKRRHEERRYEERMKEEKRKEERRKEERKDERRKEEKKEERKEKKEERKDERGKEEKKEERGKKEKEERGKEERKKEDTVVKKECNTVVAVTPPVKGTASLKPTKKEIWICGDSVISLSRMRAQFSCHGLYLGFPLSIASVYWRGIPTMMWDDLLPVLHAIYHDRDFPSIIVIHLGESDLLTNSRNSLVTRIQSDLDFIRRALPNVVIIWSSLLPKHIWKPYEESQVIESERNNVNHKMEEYCNETGVCYLSHPLITGENTSLFSPEDMLSNAGGDIFISDLRKVLNTHMDYNPS